jgi:hypothetical protein
MFQQILLASTTALLLFGARAQADDVKKPITVTCRGRVNPGQAADIQVGVRVDNEKTTGIAPPYQFCLVDSNTTAGKTVLKACQFDSLCELRGVGRFEHGTDADAVILTKVISVRPWVNKEMQAMSCKGVLTGEDGSYSLKPDAGSSLWCDADVEVLDNKRVLQACSVGKRCHIKGRVEGYGAFRWTKITSVKALIGD